MKGKLILKYLMTMTAVCCIFPICASGNGTIPQSALAAQTAECGETVECPQTEKRQNAVGECLQSSLKVYTTFVTSSVRPSFGWRTAKTYALACAQGSAVVYKIDGDDTYLITNYHVVFQNGADEEANGGKIAKDIYCYLYGSEDSPKATGKQDETYGYPLFDFGNYAVRCEYAGGSVTADLALLKVKTNEIKAVNENVREVALADGYSVGDTAIAIGNTEGEGISVTRGIVSVENEYITLAIDGVARYYRSLRIDTSIYSGNSGGGLFNAKGELIGITNAGSSEDQNINFAIPVQIVRGVIENLLCYAECEEDGARKMTLGVTVKAENSRYCFENGTGKITEDVTVVSAEANSPAAALGLGTGDIITGFGINGKNYPITRAFEISDYLYHVRSGDTVSVSFVRGDETITAEYEVTADDLAPLL